MRTRLEFKRYGDRSHIVISRLINTLLKSNRGGTTNEWTEFTLRLEKNGMHCRFDARKMHFVGK